MENARDMYGFQERARQCYQALQDGLSREIFQARLALDYEISAANTARIAALGGQREWMAALEKSIPAITRALAQSPKRLVLYGTNVTGRAIAERLMENAVEFYGFCGRRAREFPNGLMGKPVIPPEELFRRPDDFYVIVSACESAGEIADILRTNQFPPEQILLHFKPAHGTDHQYFEFPALYRRGTAFIDGGCLNCETSYAFASWCAGEYSKIFAFEPDPLSAAVCEKNLAVRAIRDFHLIRAGLSDHEGEEKFRTGLYNGSHIVRGDSRGESIITVPVTTVDRAVGEERIGFIKLDIEGAEFDALRGARDVLVRDQPLMAVSVYHRGGDMLAVMDYLRRLVPEYRFWLRHYSAGSADTVLYAAAGEDGRGA